MGRTIAIGDIHGCAFALDTLLEAIQPTHADQIICLGDMIDFGRETRDVLDCLIDLSDSCQLIGILGNHEEMLLNALENPRLLETWLNLGGWDTINSYRYAGSLDDIPLALAENSGLSPIEEVAAAKSGQLKGDCPFIGLGITQEPTADGYHSCNMKNVGVFETLIGKQEQIQLATQVVKMILKIDDVIAPAPQQQR